MDHTDTSAHRRAWDLIPWVVAGSASDEERRCVDEHAAACTDCRDELAFHRQLQAGMSLPANDLPPAEPALQRLLARIDQAPALPQPVPAHTALWPRALAAAVVVQAIGLAVLGGMLLERPRLADYQTLSQAAAPSAARIRLVPAPSLRLGELQALLGRTGLQVVHSNADGSILGLAPRAAGAPLSDLIARLRAEPGVLLAEPVSDHP